MNEAKVPYTAFSINALSNESIFDEMDKLPRYSVNNTWQEFKTSCQADFSIAYSLDELLLKYYVKEECLKTRSREINSDVHKDNCVEFFVAFDDDENYYNIEFNCLGIGKVAYGKGRQGRLFLPPSIISTIGSHIVLKAGAEGLFSWEILLRLPVSVFHFKNVHLGQGSIARANFYKCGDDLPKPHFLSWNKILTEQPDFHRPEYFGKLYFS